MSTVSEVSKASKEAYSKDKGGGDMNNQSELKGYRRLKVWQEAHLLVLLIYKLTKAYPRDELFGLVSQIRRAVVSIAANIVEGQARSSKKEFIQFLSIANGSLVEVEYFMELSHDLGYITQAEYDTVRDKIQFVGILLHRFAASLRR